MRIVFSSVNDIFPLLLIFPRMSLNCTLVPVQYREYENGLWQWPLWKWFIQLKWILLNFGQLVSTCYLSTRVQDSWLVWRSHFRAWNLQFAGCESKKYHCSRKQSLAAGRECNVTEKFFVEFTRKTLKLQELRETILFLDAFVFLSRNKLDTWKKNTTSSHIRDLSLLFPRRRKLGRLFVKSDPRCTFLPSKFWCTFVTTCTPSFALSVVRDANENREEKWSRGILGRASRPQDFTRPFFSHDYYS